MNEKTRRTIERIVENGFLYDKITVYRIKEDGTEKIAFSCNRPVVEEESEPQPTQLDRIEEQLAVRNDALRQEGADALTLELLERGIL